MMRLLWSAQFEFSWHNFDFWVTLIPGVYLQFVQIGHINWQSHENPVCFIHAVDMQFGIQGKIPTSNFLIWKVISFPASSQNPHISSLVALPLRFWGNSQSEALLLWTGSLWPLLWGLPLGSLPSHPVLLMLWKLFHQQRLSLMDLTSQPFCSTNALKASVLPTKTLSLMDLTSRYGQKLYFWPE